MIYFLAYIWVGVLLLWYMLHILRGEDDKLEEVFENQVSDRPWSAKTLFILTCIFAVFAWPYMIYFFTYGYRKHK